MAAVPLRYHSTFENQTQELKIFHARPNDVARSEQEYNRRKKQHEDSLLATVNTRTQSLEEIYRLFCEELDDCYDTDMLSLICFKFQDYLKSDDVTNKRYAEYLFAKIASWSTHEPRMCEYVTKSLNLKIALNNSTEEETGTEDTPPDAALNDNATLTPLNVPRDAGTSREDSIRIGTSILKAALQSKKEFFDQLNDEINPDYLQNTPVTTNEQVTQFLSRIQRSSGRTYAVQNHRDFYAQNEALVATAENIESAIKAIHLFSWDHSTREQKFIKKLVEALQSSSDQITIYCGIGFSRTAFTFNRTELLISIRANPSLYAEFNKALREDEAQRSSAIFSFGKTARETILPQRTEKREMFEVSDNDFATQAIILLSSLKPTEITNNERPTNIAEGLTPDDLEYEEDQEQRRETDSTVTSHSTLSGQFGLATARQRQNAILQQPFQPSGYSLLQILVNAARIFSPLILPVLPSLVIPRNLFNTRSPESGASNTQILSAPLLITSEQNTIQNESEVIQTSQEGTNFQQIENIEEEYNDGSESDKNIKKIGDSTNSDNQILNVLPMGNNPLIPTREILPDGDYDDDEDENDENTSPNIPVRTQLSSKAAGHQILPDDISVSEESESASQYCDDSDDEDADETENNKPISESNTHNLDAPLLTAVNLTIFEKNNCNPMPKTIKQEENCTIS